EGIWDVRRICSGANPARSARSTSQSLEASTWSPRALIADFELHRQDPRGGIRSRLGLLLGPGLSHPWSPAQPSAVAGNSQCYPLFSGLLVKASGNYPV